MTHQINLFNPTFRILRQPLSSWVMVQGMIFLIVVSTLCYAYARYQLSSLQTLVQSTERKLASEREHFISISAEYGRKTGSTLLADELKKFEANLSKKQTVVKILQQDILGNVDGYSEYMRAFARQLLNGLWLTGFKISRAEMVLTGHLIQPDLMPTYLQRLKNEEVMQGRSFSALQINVPKSEHAESKTPIIAAPEYLEFSISSSDIEKER